MLVPKIIKIVGEDLQKIDLLNKVSSDKIENLALDRIENFPLAHYTITSVVSKEFAMEVAMSFVLADQQDAINTDTDILSDDVLEYRTTEHNLGKMVTIGHYITDSFRRGNLYNEGFELISDGDMEFFIDEYERELVGVVLTLTVQIPHDNSICLT
jgi:hypothetical protein